MTETLPPPRPESSAILPPPPPGTDRRRSSRRGWFRRRFAERRLGALLDREYGPFGAVLHDCVPPGGEVMADHVVVVPTGVWLVVAHHEPGRVRRDGRPDGSPARLLVGRQDRTALVGRMLELRASAVAALDRNGFDWADVHPVVCFTNAHWRRFTHGFAIDGVRILRSADLVDEIEGLGPLGPSEIAAIAAILTPEL